jgi:tripartite-type tricarboxylate transporter receptor subunit TctC
LPNTPTFAEQGYQGMEVIGWFALVGPAGLPQPIVEKLHGETQRAIANPEIKQKLANIGFEPQAGSTADAVKYVAEERKRWLAVAKEHNIKVE